MKTLGVLLFDRFELLDVFGPLEILANQNLSPPIFRVITLAERAGLIASAQGSRCEAECNLTDCPSLDVLLVPGGQGTRVEVQNEGLLRWLAERTRTAELVLSVCTGSALLARAGVLDGVRATSNKRAFDWVMTQGPNVHWERRARWVEDGRFVTSSGVSAGIDMALAVVARIAGRPEAERIAKIIEHTWQSDPTVDPFAAS